MKWGAAPILVLLFLLGACANTESDTTDSSVRDRIQANLAAGRTMQALYQIDTLAAETGWSADLLLLAGNTWQQNGDVTRALPYWEAVQAAQPDVNSTLLRQMSQAYLDLNQWTQAVDTLDQLVTLDPENGWGHYQLGLIRAAFDPAAAATHLQAAARVPAYTETANSLLAVVENQADAYVVGVRLARLDLWPYAELAFQRAIDQGDAPVEALAYIGLARDQQGKDGQALVSQAVATSPENALIRYLEATHLRVTGDYRGSLESLIQATALEPDNPVYYAELGTAYQFMGDLESAERWLKVANNLSNGDPQFQQMLALFYAEEAYNLDGGGLETVENATVMLPNDPDLRAGFGWALYTMGRTEDGLNQLDSALEIEPNNVRALYYKAQILLETSDDREAAIRLLERAASQQSELEADVRRLLDGLTGE